MLPCMYRYLCYTYRQVELKKATAYRFALALLHYVLRSLRYIGFLQRNLLVLKKIRNFALLIE